MLAPLLLICATFALLLGLLFLSVAAERRILHPGAIVRQTVRARRSTPEYAEAMVAKQFEALLQRPAGDVTSDHR